MESFYKKYKSFNWNNIISYRLTSHRHAAKQGYKNSCCEHCSASLKHYYLERQKCIAAQQKVIIFGSIREAENQLKTYLLSPHMLDTNTDTKDLCYNGQRLFTKPMFEHFPTTEDTLTWKYHA
jgi:hypothetical protein